MIPERSLEGPKHSIIKIILIPGTWAYGIFRRGVGLYEPSKPPRWFEEGSKFRTALESELRLRGVLDFSIEVLQWDCANSVRSRAIQAERLAALLMSQRSPGIRRVIIGHSHGGSIACKATSLVEASDDVAVVTLSTPFLQAQPRSEDSPRSVWSFLFILLGFLCFGAFEFTRGETQLIPSLKAYGLGALILLPIIAAQLWYGSKSDEKIADRINARAVADVRFLAIRGFSDEASDAIVVGSIGTGLMNTMLYVLAFPLRWLSEGSRWRTVLSVLVAAGLLAIFLLKAVVIFKSISIWIVIAVLVTLVMGPIVIAGVCSSLFGRELFFESLNIVLTVDSVPDANCNVDVVTLTETQTSVRGLRHGIYAHPMCPRIVAYWLATGSTNVPPPARNVDAQIP